MMARRVLCNLCNMAEGVPQNGNNRRCLLWMHFEWILFGFIRGWLHNFRVGLDLDEIPVDTFGGIRAGLQGLPDLS
jgi:hypothetical protein